MGHKSECWTNIQIFCLEGTWQLIPMYMNVFTKVQSIWHLFSHFTENHKCQPHGVAMKKSGGFIILVLWMAVPNSFVPIHSVSVEIFHRIKTFWVPWRSLQNNTSIIQRLLRYSNSWNSLDQSGWTDTHTNRQTDLQCYLLSFATWTAKKAVSWKSTYANSSQCIPQSFVPPKSLGDSLSVYSPF